MPAESIRSSQVTYRYSASALLKARHKHVCLSRRVRRKLQYFSIFVRPISIVLSNRSDSLEHQNEDDERERQLVQVPLLPKLRRPRKRHLAYPSLLLSNVRSVFNKMDECSELLRRQKPDLCVFTESWLSDDIPNSAILIDEYCVFRQDRSDRNGGGLLCYVRDSLSCSEIDLHFISSSSSRTEFLAIFLNDIRLLVICVYHPFWNDSSAHRDAITRLTEIIDHHRLIHGSELKIILCGDFNGLRNHLADLTSLTQLVAIVKKPTRGSHCLDQILVNFATDVKPCFFPPIGKSDHRVVFWRPQSSNAPRLPKKVKIRKFSRSSLAKFHDAISHMDWLSFVEQIPDVDQAVVDFLGSIFLIYDFFFPLRTVRIRPTEPKWMKLSLKVLIDDRDRAFHSNQMGKYLRLRKEVFAHIKHLKSQYIAECAASCDSAKLWSSLRRFGGCSKSRSCNVSFSVSDFNDYFSSNFQGERLKVNTKSEGMLSFPDTSTIPSLTPDDVLYFLRRLPNKSCGADGVPSWVLRNCRHILCGSIANLFNRCVSESHFPDIFKQANIVPIPKCERPQNVSDFRPISILPALAKLFEKIICAKFVLPIVTHRIDPLQFAYIPRPGSGTTCATVLTYHKIIRFLDSASGAVRFLTIDFSKAFDKILHEHILRVCADFQFPRFLFDLISSFLSSRIQRVVINGSVSRWSSISSGVPQGSVLGPVLFCLALNELSPICSNSMYIKYADDISVLHFVRNSSEDCLQTELDHIVSWSKSVCLPINFSKCKVMNVVTSKRMSLPDLVLSDRSIITEVKSLSFLGVTFCDNMKWADHIDRAVKRACKRIFIIINLRRSGCSEILMFRAYCAFIRSLLLYCCPVFCNAPVCLTSKMSAIERRVFRIIGGPLSFPHLLEVAESTCIRLMRSIESSPDHPLNDLFTVNPRVRNTRCQQTLLAPFAKTRRLSSSFIKFCNK